MLRRMMILSLVLTIVGCGSQTPAQQTQTAAEDCRSVSPQFSEIMTPIAEEWDDAVKLTGKTARMALPNQISSLQAIRRKANDVDAPDCLKTAKASLIKSMDSTIEGFLAFMGQESETTVNKHLTTAATAMKDYQDQLIMATSGVDMNAPKPTNTPKPPTPTINYPGDLSQLKMMDNAQLGQLLLSDGDPVTGEKVAGMPPPYKGFTDSTSYKLDLGSAWLSRYNTIAEAREKMEDLQKNLKYEGKVSSTINIGDVGRTSIDKKDATVFFSRCSVLVYIQFKKADADTAKTYAKAIDQRIQATCNQ